MASVQPALTAIGLIIFNYIFVVSYHLGTFSLFCALDYLYPC